jgi:hypothetical protein
MGQAFGHTSQEKFLYCGMGVPPVLKMVQVMIFELNLVPFVSLKSSSYI